MPTDTGACDAGTDLESEPAQVLCDQPRGACFLVAEFRVLMNISPPAIELRLTAGDSFTHLRFERLAIRPQLTSCRTRAPD
jgi:hypothetical protein